MTLSRPHGNKTKLTRLLPLEWSANRTKPHHKLTNVINWFSDRCLRFSGARSPVEELQSFQASGARFEKIIIRWWFSVAVKQAASNAAFAVAVAV